MGGQVLTLAVSGVSDESPKTLLGRERAWADTVNCLRILDSSRAERLQLDCQVRTSCSLPCVLAYYKSRVRTLTL